MKTSKECNISQSQQFRDNQKEMALQRSTNNEKKCERLSGRLSERGIGDGCLNKKGALHKTNANVPVQVRRAQVVPDEYEDTKSGL